MFTKKIVPLYHHTVLSTKTSYKILFSHVKSFYLKSGSYFNVYGSVHIHFIYKYKYSVVKLYLNLCFCSGNICFFFLFVCMGGGVGEAIILLPRTPYSKGFLVPAVSIFH